MFWVSLGKPLLDKVHHVLVVFLDILVVRQVVVHGQDEAALIVTVVAVAVQRGREGFARHRIQTREKLQLITSD